MFPAAIIFAAIFGSMTFQAGQDNPDANGILDSKAKVMPKEHFIVDEQF